TGALASSKPIFALCHYDALPVRTFGLLRRVFFYVNSRAFKQKSVADCVGGPRVNEVGRGEKGAHIIGGSRVFLSLDLRDEMTRPTRDDVVWFSSERMRWIELSMSNGCAGYNG